MSLVLTDCKLYVAEHDLSGYMNALSVVYSAEMLDETTFGSGGTRKNAGGLKGIVAQHEGIWNATPDEKLFGNVGVQNVPVTICPTDGADGDIAYLFRAIHSEYNPGAQVGELLRYSVSMEGSGAPLVRGQILHPAGAVTESDDDAGHQLGAIAAGKTLYAALHILSASSGDTLDVTIESDDNANFTSATTRIAFSQASDVGSEWKALAGPITDTHWRVSFTIGGSDPSFSFVVAAGII